MAHSRLTFDLDGNWDVHLDEAGRIALRRGAAATAQNVANECRLFRRDAYFAYDKGLPHFLLELGSKSPPAPLLASLMRRAALGVRDVSRVIGVDVETFDPVARRASGRISIETREGESVVAGL
jgi:hypothetical protein